jgi:hypothetical protein
VSCFSQSFAIRLPTDCRSRCRHCQAVTCRKANSLHPSATLFDVPYMGRSAVHTIRWGWGGLPNPTPHLSQQNLPGQRSVTRLNRSKLYRDSTFPFSGESVVATISSIPRATGKVLVRFIGGSLPISVPHACCHGRYSHHFPRSISSTQSVLPPGVRPSHCPQADSPYTTLAPITMCKPSRPWPQIR